MDAHFIAAKAVFKDAGGSVEWYGLMMLARLKSLCKLVGKSSEPAQAPPGKKLPLLDTLIAPVEPEDGLTRAQTAEKRLMVWALERHAFQNNLAAHYLSMPPSSFHDKARRYGIR